MTTPTWSFFIVDDNPDIVELMTVLLEVADHRVESTTVSSTALERIRKAKPDCILLDIMMPEMDGYALCKLIRESPELAGVRIVFISAKAFEYDRNRAIELGADAYMVKPIQHESFVDELEKIMIDRMKLSYWGVRGTLPMSGPDTLKYGGHTSCVSVEFPRGQFVIFDAGSGIKALSNHLMASGQSNMSAKIFISHPHWDHINALPFFAPLFIQGNEFEILGASHGDITMAEMISAQMDGVYFPIRIKEFAARVSFRAIGEGSYEVDGIKVKTMLLNHPGQCLGYRIDYQGRSFSYVTDNELPLESSPHYNQDYVDHLVEFVSHSDILITDTTYTDEEYPSKELWGHSPVSQVAKLAARAEVKNLHLFHHDPDQTDDDIDRKLQTARSKLSELGSDTVCSAPVQGESLLF